jgi:hypothetical protein
LVSLEFNKLIVRELKMTQQMMSSGRE